MPPTPSNSQPPKKPTAPAPVAKGVSPPPAKPGPVPAKPGPVSPPRTGAPVAKAAAKPAAAAKGPSAPKPKTWGGADAGSKKLGQVLVDLGYIDDVQLEEILFDARSNDIPLERLVVDLVDLGRVGRADFTVHRERVDLLAIAATSVQRHAPRAYELGITLTASPSRPGRSASGASPSG